MELELRVSDGHPQASPIATVCNILLRIVCSPFAILQSPPQTFAYLYYVTFSVAASDCLVPNRSVMIEIQHFFSVNLYMAD